MLNVHQDLFPEHRITQCERTHASQWAKNTLSLTTFFELNQADVTVTETSVVAIRTVASSSSPSRKPIASKSDWHDDI